MHAIKRILAEPYARGFKEMKTLLGLSRAGYTYVFTYVLMSEVQVESLFSKIELIISTHQEKLLKRK